MSRFLTVALIFLVGPTVAFLALAGAVFLTFVVVDSVAGRMP
ncbi:MAG TPA: hypothetical protein VMT30_09340 [Candidatus Saccharimonadia bacterium]|nr:hypothetical protein [Candidatus Saccharimonadia bacterium]